MIARRYPYAETGRVAAWPFALAGALMGVAAAEFVPNGPPPPINAVLRAAVCALTSFLVFSSEGPRQRPGGPVQGAVADGIVAGIIAFISAGLLDVLAAAGAGTSGGRGVSAATFFETVGLGLLFGASIGTGLGFLIVPLVGRDRLGERYMTTRPARRSKRKRRKR